MKYTPSINIENSEFNKDSYIVTNNALQVIGRIVNSFHAGIHSFNIIGSYGTGKSNFILALEDSLANNSDILISNNGQFNGCKKIKFIKIVGEYSSLETLLKHNLFPRSQKGNIFNLLNNLLDKAEKNDEFIFLVIDEFGKLLEFAANNQPEREFYLFQTLAEIVNNQKRNIILITTQHQNSFAYFRNLDNSQKNEWIKVQGRYKEIVFNEPVEQLVYLASERIGTLHREILNKNLKKIYELAKESRIISDTIKYETAKRLYPLDAFAIQALTLSIQRYGQNERSLFSFLESSGSSSLQDFKDTESTTYNLADVYDYDIYNFHSYLADVNADSASWTMMRVAIERVEGILQGQDVIDCIKLVKAIGMINLFGNAGVHLSEKELCFYAKHAMNVNKPEALISSLVQYKIIRYAEYKNQYILFEGTDVNLESELFKASSIVPRSKDVIDKLSEHFNLPFEFANAAYFHRGTPRYFEYAISDSPIKKSPHDEIDGYINLIFNEDLTIDEILKETSSCEEAILYAYFKNTDTIIDNLWKLDKLFYVQNIIDCQDKVAHKEIKALISHEQDILNASVLKTLFEYNEVVTWIYRGEVINIKSKTDFNKFLSYICEDVYPETPIFNNEMINKHKPSSAMATAKGNLFTHLMENSNDPMFGFEESKFPPEKTIYLALLKNTGIHRKFLGEYELGAPKDPSFAPLWTACESFMESTKERPRKVGELINILSTRPFKLKRGIIDIWVPLYLIIKKDDYSLYNNNGIYIPYFNKDVLDLFQKSLEQFSIKAFDIDGVKLDLFNKYREVIGMGQDNEFAADSLVKTIKPFLIFYKKLDTYTKKTKKLSKTTLQFRDVLATAKDPEKTFFEDLPRALGFKDTKITQDSDVLKRYVELIQNAIRELRSCYNGLIKRMESAVVKAINLTSKDYSEYKKEVIQRYSNVKTYLLTEQEKTFLTRVLANASDKKKWFESLAYVIIDKQLENILDEEENYLIENLIHSFKELDKYIDVSNKNFKTDSKFIRFEMISDTGTVSPQMILLNEKKASDAEILEKKINDLLSGDNEIDSFALLSIIKKKFNND